VFCGASYAVLWWSAVVCGGLRFSDLPLRFVTIIIVIIRPHRRTAQMRPIATDGVAWSVCLSVCHDREPAKPAEPIDVPFLIWTRVGPRQHVLNDGPDSPCEGAILSGGRGGP